MKKRTEIERKKERNEEKRNSLSDIQRKHMNMTLLLFSFLIEPYKHNNKESIKDFLQRLYW